jgi:putative transcriptional regulator
MSLRGRLLVAEPSLDDPNFRRTVVYLIEHSEGGALGLVLNRPGEVPVREAVPGWAPYVDGIDTVFVGGPVSPEGAICLARCPSAGPADSLFDTGDDDGEDPDPTAIFKPISTTIGALDLHGDPTDAPPGVSALRIFAGYAGWSGGQLEAELDAGGWYVVDALDDDVFTQRPGALWREVLRRQRGAVRAIAFAPEDPRWN